MSGESIYKYNVAGSPDSSPERPRRLVPPLWLLGLIVVLGCAIAWVRRPDGIDNAIANIVTLVLSFLGTMAVLVWFSGFSGYAKGLRVAVPAILGLAVVVALGTLRIDRVSGDLVPEFKVRWAPKPDRELDKPAVADAGLGIGDIPTAATATDYPQFLGPNRSIGVDTIVLDRDWKAHPPQEVWRHKIGAGWSAFATIGPYAATMEQRGDDELVTFYNWSDGGKLLWSQGTPARHETVLGGIGPRSTPTIDSGRVYALGATGMLRCLDAATGNVLWSHDLLKEFGVASTDEDLKSVAWGRSASPLVNRDLLIVPVGGPAGGPKYSLVAYDKVSGEKRWQAGDRQVAYASPVAATLGGVEQILIVNEDNVSSHDPLTGAVLWQHEWPGNSSTDATASQPIAVSDDQVFLSKGYSGGAALLKVAREGDAWTATRIWDKPGSLKTKFTNVAIHNGYVYGLSDGILECLDLATGKRKWKQGRYGHGQLLRVGDVLLVLADTGELLLVEASPERLTVLGSIAALDGQTWNNLALAGDHLLLRNAEEAVCYKLATVAPTGKAEATPTAEHAPAASLPE